MLFHFVKQKRYYFEMDAIREPHSSHRQPNGSAQVRNAPRLYPHMRVKTAANPRLNGQRLPPEPGEQGAFHPNGKNPGDVWAIPSRPSQLAHFAVFPEQLVDRPLRATTRPGDIVLDPFAGSGTVGSACLKIDRTPILCDLSATYLRRVARPRLRVLGNARLITPRSRLSATARSVIQW